MFDTDKTMQSILRFAESQEPIRAAVLNGSRANPKVEPDKHQDYDVVFFVRSQDLQRYKDDRKWLHRFGELVICQQNDFGPNNFIFMMQYRDCRLDLCFIDLEDLNGEEQGDSLTIPLLDKDNILPQYPETNDGDYLVKKPSCLQWDECLNELRWIETYVAKGIVRDEYSLVRFLYDSILMKEVVRLLSWKVGMEHEWTVNVGKEGKWLKRYLDEELYGRFADLYGNRNYQDLWDNTLKLHRLVRDVAQPLSRELGYHYPAEEDFRVLEYLEAFNRSHLKGVI